jgi:hypothetical protein
MFNKGAMFGLDARIALAIFGALSVISGAALYSAIQDAKVTAIATELEEMSKAYQAYVIDVGSNLDYRANPTASTVALKTVELLDSTKTGWQGPYLPFSTADMSSSDSEHSILSDKYETIFILKSRSGPTFGSYTTGGGQTSCVGNDDKCSVYIGLFDVGSLELAKAIDVKVDGSEGANAGKLRARVHSGKHAVYYEVMPDIAND